MQFLQPIIHYGLHFLLPLAVAVLFFKERWKQAYLLMVATMVIDLDHLFAYPDVFVPDRCSIDFHPLHSYPAIGVYVVLLAFPKTRTIAVGLLIHMLADAEDCLWML